MGSWGGGGGGGGNALISPAAVRRGRAAGEYGRSLLEWEELPGYSRCDGATSLLVAPAFMHGTCLSRFLVKPRGNTDGGVARLPVCDAALASGSTSLATTWCCSPGWQERHHKRHRHLCSTQHRQRKCQRC